MTRSETRMLLTVILLIFCLSVFSSGYADGEKSATEPALENRGAFLSAGETHSFSVNVPQAGDYALKLTYRIERANMQPATLDVRVGGQTRQSGHKPILLPELWRDDSQQYAVNEYGNDLYPQPVHVEAVQTVLLRGRVYYEDAPLTFSLAKGTNNIEITARDAELTVFDMTAERLPQLDDFAAYRSGIPMKAAPETCIVIEGEHYAGKSAASIRGSRSRSSALHPFDAAHNRINALDAGTWQEPGEGVHYAFDIPEEGVYYIALRVSQSEKNDTEVYKTILIDGRTLLQPLAAYGFLIQVQA